MEHVWFHRLWKLRWRGELRPDVQNQYNSEILYYLKEEGEKEKEEG